MSILNSLFRRVAVGAAALISASGALSIVGSWTAVRAAGDPVPVRRAAHHANSDLANYAVVAPGVLRGAAPTDKGLAKLKAMGVRTLIDLRIEKRGREEEVASARALGLSRVHIPLGREAPTPKQVALFLATVNDPAKQPVYVHCQHGADRTGAMIGIYRVTHDHWTFDQAYREMRHFGFKPYLTELRDAVRQRAASQ